MTLLSKRKPNRVIELKDINFIFVHIHKMQIFLNKDIFYHKSFLKGDSNLTEKVKKQFSFFLILKTVYYTVIVHNFDLQEKTTRNNNNTITAK